eukprot:4502277-Amphidinium_carterae.1
MLWGSPKCHKGQNVGCRWEFGWSTVCSVAVTIDHNSKLCPAVGGVNPEPHRRPQDPKQLKTGPKWFHNG